MTREIYLEHKRNGLRPITIYPEVVRGNPMFAESVVRYILNVPGLLGGDESFSDDEFLLAYDPVFVPQTMERVAFLKTPVIDDNIFNCRVNDVTDHRDLILVYSGRFQAARELYPEIYETAIEITSSWPETKTELANLFRRAKVVFVFELTAIDAEARLCGCAVVRLASSFLVNFEALRELDEAGVAIGWDDIGLSRAFDTVGQFEVNYAKEKSKFNHDLLAFIDATQSMA